ncbi:hypothetical protein, conserved in T. vivax, (fragment), partial [Trypanosoma vivax Y486]
MKRNWRSRNAVRRRGAITRMPSYKPVGEVFVPATFRQIKNDTRGAFKWRRSIATHFSAAPSFHAEEGRAARPQGRNEAQQRSSGQPWPSSLRQHMAKGGTNTAAQWQGLRAQRCESGSIHRAEAVCREEKRIVGEKWETAAFVKAPQRAVRNANGAPPCRGRLSTGKVSRDAERHSATLRSTAGLSEGEHGLRKQMPKRRSNYTSPASSRAGFDTLQLNKAPRAKQETNKTWSHQMKRRRPWRTGQPECVARFGASQMNLQRGKRAAQCKTRQITTQMCK